MTSLPSGVTAHNSLLTESAISSLDKAQLQGSDPSTGTLLNPQDTQTPRETFQPVPLWCTAQTLTGRNLKKIFLFQDLRWLQGWRLFFTRSHMEKRTRGMSSCQGDSNYTKGIFLTMEQSATGIISPENWGILQHWKFLRSSFSGGWPILFRLCFGQKMDQVMHPGILWFHGWLSMEWTLTRPQHQWVWFTFI